jgi:hypothetical protein
MPGKRKNEFWAVFTRQMPHVVHVQYPIPLVLTSKWIYSDNSDKIRYYFKKMVLYYVVVYSTGASGKNYNNTESGSI